jgi:hypothetical protein
MSVMPTGSIMAATVCSPMNEASTPQVSVMPKLMRTVLVPVTFTMAQAMRRSSFCFTTATASISAPMMNRTESVIRLLATSVDSMPSNTTCPTTIISATVGSGTGSVMNRIVANIDMVSTIWPSRLKPS